MLERKINLKRNSLLLFLAKFLPIIFWGGVITIWAYFGFNSEISKWISFLSFVLALFFSIRAVIGNKGFITFSDDGICINSDEKILICDVARIVCDEKSKRIELFLNNFERIRLVNFSTVPQLGYSVYHKVKCELCRYYPGKAAQLSDVSVQNYIETGLISENIERKDSTGRAQLVVLLFFEFVLSLVPLALSLLATAWVGCKILILILQGVVIVLNLFK